MATPFNPDAVTRVPRTPQPTLPDLGQVSPPNFSRTVRQRSMPTHAELAPAVPPAEDPDSAGWLSLDWVHAAFLAREAMEQAFASLRGDEA